ncbi:RNA-directed DNA polymerase from mobile element jockey-like [Plakobranchus ocellatus]|uniref:RNA-directed DNA polymerase from mobile element jockey-like n=1 Tax=Plakobranchus ocellatus TaxID=259542 RepID=A0AAV4B5G5_9GAST|nr:RNA-directed DNA polymerase from mobile element jockey-like [Plakobranchus ocellatus]
MLTNIKSHHDYSPESCSLQAIIQAYALTTDHEDEEVENFYNEVQKTLNEVSKKDIIVVQGDWNAKIGEDAQEDWEGTCGQYCNQATKDRGLRLLEFAKYNDLKIMNTFGPHKPSRRWTWHSPGGEYHNQIDYILIKRRFQSSLKIAKIRSFPGADHELVMITFALRLKKNKKRGNIRIKFDVDKLKDPNILTTFQANTGGRFAPLLALDNDQYLTPDDLAETFNEALPEEASKLLGKPRVKKKKWMTDKILALCDQRRSEKERARGCLKHNNSNKAYKIVKELTDTKQARATTIESKEGKRLTEEKEILERWTEYCSELYTHVATNKDPNVLNVPPSSNNARDIILRAEIIETVSSLKPGKSAGIDNITGEMVQTGGEATIDMLLLICNKILQTGV